MFCFKIIIMKVEELRIGNLLYWVISPEVKKLHPVLQINTVYINDEIPNNYEPIPLTEEWLLKLGFKKVVYKSTHPDFTDETCYELEYKEFFISYADDFSMTLFVSKKTQDDELGICPDFKNMRYVHQLQNLYCALTGEELTINEI